MSDCKEVGGPCCSDIIADVAAATDPLKTRLTHDKTRRKAAGKDMLSAYLRWGAPGVGAAVPRAPNRSRARLFSGRM